MINVGKLFVLFATLGLVKCVSVLGPRVLRPYSNYKVSVSGGPRALNLFVAIEGKRANGEQFSQGRVIQVQEATSRLVDLEIDDPGPGNYRLTARSTSGPQFSSSAALVYQPRSFCVFVQTDKSVYQPGDTINFRAIALDKYLLPLSNTIDVSVLDAGGSPIRDWAAVPLDRGVYANELTLADEPALGEWTIQVEVRGQKYSRTITVADYVLPKFDMHLEAPKEVLFSDGRFDINVTAKHFNGMPVQGELTISAYAVFFSGLLQPVFSSPARKVIKFNGSVEVPYDLKTDLDLAEDAARPLVIEAVIEEKDTLIRQNISRKILLLRTPYRLKVSAPEHFKPQLPYVVQIEVVNTTGDIIDEAGTVTVERLWDDGAPVNMTTVDLSRGVARYSYTPDLPHINSTLNLVAKYRDVSERVVNVQRGAATDDGHLTIELLTRDTAPGDEMRARITATETMDLLHYVVIGRGDILTAKTLELRVGRRSVDVAVPVFGALSPGCTLLAWHPRPDGRVLAAALHVPHRQLLQHKVSITSITPTTIRPNGLVEIRVSGEEGSLGALLGIDEKAIANGLASANGLGSGLDLHTIEREVESFNGLRHSTFKNEDQLPGLGLDLGGYNTMDVFKNAGVVILTDGVVADEKAPAMEEVETGTRAPAAGPYAFSRVPPPPSPRHYLTRPLAPNSAFMFANLSIGNDGLGGSERWSPTTTGEWSVGAFAVHPTLGLGLAMPQKFETTLPLSITAELPETLQRGESIAAVITLKSSLNVDTSVEVTFHNSDQYYEFEPLENNVDTPKKIELFRRSRVKVPARGSASTAFLVTAARAGEAPVIVEAAGNGVSASLFRTLYVKDGYEEDIWSWSLLDGRRGVARANVTLTPAPGTKLGAVSLEATGDLLAGSLRATREPLNLAVDPAYALRPMARACVLLDYLQATEQTDEVTITKDARAQASAGYQRLMAFRRPDGAFTQELGEDAETDVWMTSMAARWLSRSARYVAVSPSAGAGAARWLAHAQLPDGSWRPAARAARNDPHATAVPLAAHALLALIETNGGEVLYKNAINKALDFVAKNISPDLDPFSLAVASTALAAARHPQATTTLQVMEKYANSTDGMLFWSRKIVGTEWRNPWLKSNSLEAATAAWGLRAMLAARLTDEAVPVARYLLQALGTKDQDPEVLDAVAQFAQAIRTPTKLRIAVNVTGFDEPRQFNIDDDNALIIQTQLVRNARSTLATTSGRGVCAVGLRARGATNVTAAWPRYTLDPRVDQVSTSSRLQLSVCIGFVPVGNETESGLVLVTINLPSGYLADINTITGLTAAPHVVGARVMGGGSAVAAWARAGLAERCATLSAPRALPVARQRPAAVTIIDLYDSSHRARVFYQAVDSSACEVCGAWAACERACGAAAGQRAPPPSATPAPDSAPASASAAILLVVPLLMLLR
ncbi:CD109 antigen-like [Aricia agestis]|uniref:CD109 antigen-like n=1 Tax=Aricia agestis TaxID=91739 RepID=UPI001C201BE1|nr:CD109 antigen-like [Aricia agestis]XP_041987020.1 CD109 antigen-like [Aricia agestis]